MAKGGESKPKRETTNRLSTSEIRQMEKLIEEGKDDLLDESFHEKLSEEFNSMRNRAGNKGIQMKQVQNFFMKRISPKTEAINSSNSSEGFVQITDTNVSNNAAPESSSDTPTDTLEKDPVEEELEFEARSYRDNAWYDVATFLAHRVLSTGEPEVRVRFHGFGSEEDEWVNVRMDVRERSIPLEASECHKVEVGHLVLCFQERSEHAMYFDAHVLEIERRTHDIRGCRCLFLVRYDHDQTEERVGLRRMCRRPRN